MSIEQVQQIADAVGGKIESTGGLPDGSGFATMSMPLPKTHWIYQKGPDGYSMPPPMPFRMGGDHHLRLQMSDKIREAAKYAVRGATMHGQENDFDPDALLQNLIVGLFGYHTADGLSGESWGNPDPVPPLYCPPNGSAQTKGEQRG
jgi:hypothetical protein